MLLIEVQVLGCGWERTQSLERQWEERRERMGTAKSSVKEHSLREEGAWEARLAQEVGTVWSLWNRRKECIAEGPGRHFLSHVVFANLPGEA